MLTGDSIIVCSHLVLHLLIFTNTSSRSFTNLIHQTFLSSLKSITVIRSSVCHVFMWQTDKLYRTLGLNTEGHICTDSVIFLNIEKKIEMKVTMTEFNIGPTFLCSFYMAPFIHCRRVTFLTFFHYHESLMYIVPGRFCFNKISNIW